MQDRNSHSLLKDFYDELDLYLNAGELVDFLLGWEPSPGDTLPQVIHCLYRDLVAKGFIERPDAETAAAWIGDLARVGYVFPGVVEGGKGEEGGC